MLMKVSRLIVYRRSDQNANEKKKTRQRPTSPSLSLRVSLFSTAYCWFFLFRVERMDGAGYDGEPILVRNQEKTYWTLTDFVSFLALFEPCLFPCFLLIAWFAVVVVPVSTYYLVQGASVSLSSRARNVTTKKSVEFCSVPLGQSPFHFLDNDFFWYLILIVVHNPILTTCPYFFYPLISPFLTLPVEIERMTEGRKDTKERKKKQMEL